MLKIIIITIISVTECFALAPIKASSQNIPDSESFLLRSFAFQLEENRTEQETILFKNYKNSSGFRYWLKNIYPHQGNGISINNIFKRWTEYVKRNPFFDEAQYSEESNIAYLSDPLFNNNSPPPFYSLPKSFKKYGIIKNDKGIIPPLTKYEQLVLSLKKGDTILFKDEKGNRKKIVLGRFIGAGNASHVFNVAETDLNNIDQPAIVKIPLLIKRFAHSDKSCIYGRRSIETLKKTSLAMEGKLPSFERVKFPFVKILYTSPYNEVAIIEKANGFSMKNWLENFLRKNSNFENTQVDYFRYFSKNDSLLFQKLINFFLLFQDTFYIQDIHPSQIVYDIDKEEWTLIDWLGYSPFSESDKYPRFTKFLIYDLESCINKLDGIYSECFKVILKNLKNSVDTDYQRISGKISSSAS